MGLASTSLPLEKQRPPLLRHGHCDLKVALFLKEERCGDAGTLF